MNPHVDYILTCVGVMVTAITCLVCVACLFFAYLFVLWAINAYNNLRRMDAQAVPQEWATAEQIRSQQPPEELLAPTPHLNGFGRRFSTSPQE